MIPPSEFTMKKYGRKKKEREIFVTSGDSLMLHCRGKKKQTVKTKAIVIAVITSCSPKKLLSECFNINKFSFIFYFCGSVR